MYEDCNQMEVNTEADEVESNVYEKKVQQRLRYKDQRKENLRINFEDNISDVMVVCEEKKSKPLSGGKPKSLRSDAHLEVMLWNMDIFQTKTSHIWWQ